MALPVRYLYPATALRLSLAVVAAAGILGCATQTGPAAQSAGNDVPAFYQTLASANRQAAVSTNQPIASTSIQVATVGRDVGYDAPQADTPQPLLRKGHVLLRRTAEALPPPSQAETEARLQQLAVQALEAREGQIIARAKTEAEATAAGLKGLVEQISAQKAEAAKRELLLAQQTDFDRFRNETSQNILVVQQAQATTAAQAKEEARLQAEYAKLAAQKNTEAITTALRDAVREQFATLTAQTSATVAAVAQLGQGEVAALREATAGKLAVLQAESEQKALSIATAKADEVATRLALTQQQVLKPEQVRQIADAAVTEATPNIKAIALSTLGESESYIRTVARSAVVEGDPAMREALANAAQQAVLKDDKLVFAIRKVVDERLEQTAANNAAAQNTGGEARTVIGPDGKPTIIAPSDVVVDAQNLKISPLLPPGVKGSPEYERKLASIGAKPSLLPARQRADWIDLRAYRVVLHEDGKPLEKLLGDVLKRAEPFTGPWQLKWKISDENADILQEKFSLDAETTFEEFVSYLANYMVNYRGIKLSFSLFDSERVLVVSD